MSSLQSLDIAARSATTVSPPDIRHRPQVQEVAKLIDPDMLVEIEAEAIIPSAAG